MTIFAGLGSVEGAPEEILHPGSRLLFRHWEAIRGEREAPERREIDLKHIKAIVPWLAILQRHPFQSIYTWRLAGTGVCRLWTRDVTGEVMFADWDRFERDTMHSLLDGVVGQFQPCIARFKGVSAQGEAIGLELLALPVTSQASSVTRVLATVLPFREPTWLGTIPLTHFEMSCARVIWTEPVPAAPSGASRERMRPFQVIRGGRAQ